METMKLFANGCIWFISILILFIVWIVFTSFSYAQLNTNENLFGRNGCNNLLFVNIMNNQTNSIRSNDDDIVRTTKCVYFDYEQNRYNIVVYILWLIFGPVLGIIIYLIMQCCYGLKKTFYTHDEIEEEKKEYSNKPSTRRTYCSSYNNNGRYPSVSSYNTSLS